MCLKCLKEIAPDRGTTTLNGGSYFLNYKGCGACGVVSLVKVINKEKEETETTETIRFTHVCPDCNHVICEHLYEFEIKGEFQEYSMTCDLCGTGSATCSIDPEDPRLMSAYDNQ